MAAASNSTQGPASPSAPLRPRLYVYKLASFVRFTHINTHICTYTPLYIHMYIHIFQDNKAKVLGGTYITHPPGSPHTERLHMCYTHICTHIHTYIHTHIHTYTHTYIHTLTIYTYICTYWREPAGGRRKVPGTYIHNLDGLHTYVFRSHLGTISVKRRVPLEPVGRSTSQRR